MEEGLVYSLCKGRENSNRYYEHIASYGDKVIFHMNKDTHHIVKDFIFCGRKRLEYHLNMAGAEILNRAYRQE